MITLEDCIGLCGLTEEEVLAIAEHEHLPEVAATALAQYLLSHEHGSEKVRDMIIDDFRQAQRSGDKKHVLTLLHVLHHFLKTHPERRAFSSISIISPTCSRQSPRVASIGSKVVNDKSALLPRFWPRDRPLRLRRAVQGGEKYGGYPDRLETSGALPSLDSIGSKNTPDRTYEQCQ
jgi:hypothetical protein